MANLWDTAGVFGEAILTDGMKTLSVAVLISTLPLSGLAGKTSVQQPCVITYSIIEKDTLGNVNQGASAKNQKWLTQNLEKKYSGVCYAPPDPSVKIVLLITITPATYNGTRLITNTANTTGNVSGSDGSSATYDGTTTSTTAVPYSFDYGKYMLTVETLEPNGKVTVNRRFAQDGIFRTMYGMAVGTTQQELW